VEELPVRRIYQTWGSRVFDFGFLLPLFRVESLSCPYFLPEFIFIAKISVLRRWDFFYFRSPSIAQVLRSSGFVAICTVRSLIKLNATGPSQFPAGTAIILVS
jgi:hypothetical protein